MFPLLGEKIIQQYYSSLNPEDYNSYWHGKVNPHMNKGMNVIGITNYFAIESKYHSTWKKPQVWYRNPGQKISCLIKSIYSKEGPNMISLLSGHSIKLPLMFFFLDSYIMSVLLNSHQETFLYIDVEIHIWSTWRELDTLECSAPSRIIMSYSLSSQRSSGRGDRKIVSDQDCRNIQQKITFYT